MSSKELVPRIGVGVIILNSEGKVLLGKRKGSHGEGQWSFAGGHLEWKETLISCAKRESFEETGLLIDSLSSGPYTEDLYEDSDKHYVTFFLVGKVVGGFLENKEPHKCEGWNWFDWDQLPRPLFRPICLLLETGYRPLL